MPGLDPEPASVRLCQTSILPWGADAFAVWRTGSVDVLAGANLFKFGPLRRAAREADELRSSRRPLAEQEREGEVQDHEHAEAESEQVGVRRPQGHHRRAEDRELEQQPDRVDRRPRRLRRNERAPHDGGEKRRAQTEQPLNRAVMFRETPVGERRERRQLEQEPQTVIRRPHGCGRRESNPHGLSATST